MKRGRKPKYDFSNKKLMDFISSIASTGLSNDNIAQILGLSAIHFRRILKRNPELWSQLSACRARTRVNCERPSSAKFKLIWEQNGKNRRKVATAMGVSIRTLHRWAKQDAGIADIMIFSDLEFYENLDNVGHKLALGSIKGNDSFPGWNRKPSISMLIFMISSYRHRLGLDKDETIIQKKESTDIESWIIQKLAPESENYVERHYVTYLNEDAK